MRHSGSRKYYGDLKRLELFFRNNGTPIEFVISDKDFNIDENVERMRIIGLSVNVLGWFDLTSEEVSIKNGTDDIDFTYNENYPLNQPRINAINENIIVLPMTDENVLT